MSNLHLVAGVLSRLPVYLDAEAIGVIHRKTVVLSQVQRIGVAGGRNHIVDHVDVQRFVVRVE